MHTHDGNMLQLYQGFGVASAILNHTLATPLHPITYIVQVTITINAQYTSSQIDAICRWLVHTVFSRHIATYPGPE